jgi:hypothetical protein
VLTLFVIRFLRIQGVEQVNTLVKYDGFTIISVPHTTQSFGNLMTFAALAQAFEQ